MRVFWIILSSVGITLQLLVILAMLKGALRRFPFLFVYSVTLFLTTVVEAAAFYDPAIWNRTTTYYWISDAIRQVLIFCVVISLTYTTMAAGRRRSAMRRGLIAAACLFAGFSLVLTNDPKFGHWMTALSRNLGFFAVILNLVLWAALIRQRTADRTLLMVSGGLGIQMAGKAVGHSLRQLTPLSTFPGDLIIVLTHLFCLYIWWGAFRGSRQGYNRKF